MAYLKVTAMGKNLAQVKYCMQFCDGGTCRKHGAEEVVREVRAYLRNEGLHHQVHTMKTRCNGRCEDAPTWIIQPDDIWYKNVDVEKGLEIAKSHIVEGKPVEPYILFRPGMDFVNSDNERATPTFSFQEIEDEILGNMIMAKANANPQELYPMMKAIFERFPEEAVLQLEEKKEKLVAVTLAVRLSFEGYTLKVRDQELAIDLVIGLTPKDIPREDYLARILHVEIFELEEAYLGFKHGIRFRDRNKDFKMIAFCKNGATGLWAHFVKIFLDMDPGQLTSKVKATVNQSV